VAVILPVQICVVIEHFQSARRTFRRWRSTTDAVWNTVLLFNNYNLPFQVIVLVLVGHDRVVLPMTEPR
jgi:hypothetical protein